MKFGLLVYRDSLNIGDDVQSYAAAQFLPQVDYFLEREKMDTFKTKDNEPVAIIMNAWYMHRKWNFPPASSIYPNLVSMHITLETISHVKDFHPITLEFLDGVGGDYMRTFAPVGARDTQTLGILEQKNIPAYFSGCLTLTLPKQKIIPEDKKDKKYICLVDLDSAVQEKVLKIIEKSDLEVKIMSAVITKDKLKKKKHWESGYQAKKDEIEKYLTVYQNAACVVTSRLHVSFPCLAMETPVLTVFSPKSPRFAGLSEFLNMVSVADFLEGNYDYDFLDPPPNKPDYLKIREALTLNCRKFVEGARELDEIPVPLPYSEQERKDWQIGLMRQTLNNWRKETILAQKKLDELEKQLSKQSKQTKQTK